MLLYANFLIEFFFFYMKSDTQNFSLHSSEWQESFIVMRVRKGGDKGVVIVVAVVVVVVVVK
jgi:hypothetical protein